MSTSSLQIKFYWDTATPCCCCLSMRTCVYLCVHACVCAHPPCGAWDATQGLEHVKQALWHSHALILSPCVIMGPCL